VIQDAVFKQNLGKKMSYGVAAAKREDISNANGARNTALFS